MDRKENTMATPELDAEAEALLKAAQAADAGELGIEGEEPATPGPEASTPKGDDKPKGDEPEGEIPPKEDDTKPTPEAEREAQTAPKKKDPEKDPSKEAEKADPEKDPDAEKPDRVSSEKRERERLNESWKKLEGEKTEVRTKAAGLDKREAEIAKREEALKERQYTPENFELAAQRLREKGNEAAAKRAEEQAERLRAGERQSLVQTLEDQEKQKETFQQQWSENSEKAAAEYPELKDETSDMTQAVRQLFKQYPILTYTGQGPLHAAQIAKLRLEAASASTLQTELDGANKEIARLKKLVSIEAGGDQPPPKAKAFEDLPIDEQGASLRRQAAELDQTVGV